MYAHTVWYSCIFIFLIFFRPLSYHTRRASTCGVACADTAAICITSRTGLQRSPCVPQVVSISARPSSPHWHEKEE